VVIIVIGVGVYFKKEADKKQKRSRMEWRVKYSDIVTGKNIETSRRGSVATSDRQLISQQMNSLGSRNTQGSNKSKGTIHVGVTQKYTETGMLCVSYCGEIANQKMKSDGAHVIDKAFSFLQSRPGRCHQED
jgi:hypothetical protein